MAINIFEGARRISLLVAGVAIISVFVSQFFHAPYISFDYQIVHPNQPFLKANGSCPSDGQMVYFTSQTSKGRNVSINLCLLPMSFGKDDAQLIPYKVDDKGLIWGARAYASEIDGYEKKLKERFKIPPVDEIAMEKEISQRYWNDVENSITYLIVGLGVFGAFVWAIGWIVRGFLGIPRGMDMRPDKKNGLRNEE
jgi:hypothetical protein